MLYLTEAIDEVVFTNLATFDGKQLMDVSREGLEMDGEESQKVRAYRAGLSCIPCFRKVWEPSSSWTCRERAWRWTRRSEVQNHSRASYVASSLRENACWA